MNILDYLATEFASFDEKPFNPVDSVILSQFCMVRMELIAPMGSNWQRPAGFGRALKSRLAPARPVRFADALRAELFSTLFSGFDPDLIKETLVVLAASPRFRDLSIEHCASMFDEDEHVQFAAMTFSRKREFAYVGFRGTDQSFTGWREDFDMAYRMPVPAQELAVRYLEAVAPHLPKRLMVGGHSKGGNLAQYAALHARPAVRERIERVYDHDGPGFGAGAVSDKEYATIAPRVHKTVPQESVVGMLLETPADCTLHVVRSTGRGMQQHSPFNWEVAENDFAYADRLSEAALSAHAVSSQWLAGLDRNQTRQIVEAAFEAIRASNALDASDLISGGPRTISLLVEAAKNIDPESRDVLLRALAPLANLMAQDTARSVASRFSPKPKA
ncbi:Mbeg1-like protein [Rubneribacter sp.]